MCRPLSCVCLLVLLSSSHVQAQRLPRWKLDSGSVVQVHFGDGLTQVGTLTRPLQSTSQSVRYCLGLGRCGSSLDQSIDRPLSEVTRLAVKRGTCATRGAIIGVGVGIGFLALGSLLAKGAGGDGSSQLSPGTRAFAIATIIGIPAVIGTLIGSQRLKWDRIQ